MARDIGEWLDRLGLGRYAEAFSDNEIDLQALPHITEEDLKEIGVALGARRKLLAAIAELVSSDGPATADERSKERPAGAAAERRQLTVMFVDLVGSTALSERLDLEELRDVIRAYQETCAEVVGRFEGHVAKYIGDGILVYFGYPQAHEDDARRAVCAGLGIVAGLDALNRRIDGGHGVALSVRVGIHTGLVVAGEMGGGETREVGAIVGETPNVAARLEGLAEPNTVAISAATQRLVEGLFECDDLGPQRLKGVSEPVPVFRVRGEGSAHSRFEAVAERGLTPMVGREEEISLLMKRWRLAKEGEGQVALLSGEAGIGKSRILRGFRERLEGEPHNRILYYGSAYHQNSALYPVIDQFERGLRLTKEDGPEERLAKLEALLADLGLPVAEYLPLHAGLISVPAGERYPLPELDPQTLKQRTLDAVATLLEAMAARVPVLMVVEDAHWIDPSTLEFLSLLIERLRTVPILMVVTFRPEFETPWPNHPHLTLHTLNRLSRRECAELADKVTAGKRLPAELLDEIVARTDGVPLYVEELTKTVIESEVVREENGQYVLTGPLPRLAVPASLQDSLMARLDRLGAAKEVAQLGATLGRTFDNDLVAAISPLETGALDAALSQLVESGLVFKRGTAREAIFEFKHALVRDAAYESLLKSTRHEYHKLIAEALAGRFADTAETRPELLAHHFAEAGLAERAVPYWLMAGERAKERSANVEAIAHLTRGLEQLSKIADTDERAEQELALRIALGPALLTTRGFGAPEVREAYERACDLAERLNDGARHFIALWGLWHYDITTNQIRRAEGLAAEVLTVAERQSQPDFLLQAHHAAWTTDFFRGELASCLDHTEKGERYYDLHEHASHKFFYGGHDPSVCGLDFRGLALALLGYPDQALESSAGALELGGEIAHPNSYGQALVFGAWIRLLRRDSAAAREMAEAAFALSKEHGLGIWIGWAKFLIGATAIADEGKEEGIAHMRDAISGMGVAKVWVPLFHSTLAEALGRVGRVDEALGLLDARGAIADNGGETWFRAEIHRLRGELILARSATDRDEAQAAFNRALEVARGQSAKLLELRAAISLARLWGENKKKAEACEILSPVYGWFTEGFDTPDLQDAKVLLDELS